MKTSLIMEGGAMRGMFTCGVTDVFTEHGITFHGAAGISAGAVFGCNIKSRQPGRAVRYILRYSRDPRFCGLRCLLKTGDLFGVDFCYRLLPEILDPFDRETFSRDPMEFYVGATDVHTGLPVRHRCTDGSGRDIAWMRASASMPVVSRPVGVDGLELLDGGISDPVPFEYMESLGYDRNVLILTQPQGYRKKKASALPLMRLALGKYPCIAHALEVRHELYNIQMERIDAMERGGRALVIRPPESLGIPRTEKDPAELKRVYGLGRAEALRRLDEIRAFLAWNASAPETE